MIFKEWRLHNLEVTGRPGSQMLQQAGVKTIQLRHQSTHLTERLCAIPYSTAKTGHSEFCPHQATEHGCDKSMEHFKTKYNSRLLSVGLQPKVP